MEDYSAIKKKEILPFATVLMDLEGLMLSEISQTEKDKYCMISPICGILKKNQHKRNRNSRDWWLPEEVVEGEGLGWMKSVKVVKGYKLTVIKQVLGM